MKKLLTLVLALVLVFAIAAPAMAITDDTEDLDSKTSYVDFVNIDLALFTAGPSTSFGGFAVSPIAANKPYVVNEQLYYGIKIEYAYLDSDLNEVPNMDESDYKDAKLYLSSDGSVSLNAPSKCFINDVYGYDIAPAGWSWPWVKDPNTAISSANAYVKENLGTGNAMYAFGTGVVKKAGNIKLQLKTLRDLDVAPIVIYNGVNPAFAVSKNNTTDMEYAVDVFADWDKDGVIEKEGTVAFVLKAVKGKVAAINVTYGTVTKKIAHDITYDNTLQPKKAEKALLNTADNSLWAIVGATSGTYYQADAETFWKLYETVMNFFGFDHTKDGVLLDKHFESKDTDLYLKDEVVVQLYTGSLVIPSEVDVPKTGDAASIVGFVMIAVAMIAAGVVVSRKVRA